MEHPRLEFVFELKVDTIILPGSNISTKGIPGIITINGGSFEGSANQGKNYPWWGQLSIGPK